MTFVGCDAERRALAHLGGLIDETLDGIEAFVERVIDPSSKVGEFRMQSLHLLLELVTLLLLLVPSEPVGVRLALLGVAVAALATFGLERSWWYAWPRLWQSISSRPYSPLFHRTRRSSAKPRSVARRGACRRRRRRG